MVETQYEVIKAGQPKAPPRSLIRISGDRNLTASLEAFGPNYFNRNVAEMQKQYSHPQTGEIITFREPTTAESSLIASYDFRNKAKPQIFDPHWLQLGRGIKTSDGVYLNPLKNTFSGDDVDENALKNALNNTKKIKVGKGYIYLGDNDFAFVEYNSFTQGVIEDSNIFIREGLARGLEHTAEIEAPNFKRISAKENYPRGVNVRGFEPVKQPIVKVAGLDSYGSLGDGRLVVRGDFWGDGDSGYVFGVLE